MRYIPEYYVITEDEYRQECKLNNTPITDEALILLSNAKLACEAYRQAIIQAQETAYHISITPYLHKNIVYSRTWGK